METRSTLATTPTELNEQELNAIRSELDTLLGFDSGSIYLTLTDLVLTGISKDAVAELLQTLANILSENKGDEFFTEIDKHKTKINGSKSLPEKHKTIYLEYLELLKATMTLKQTIIQADKLCMDFHENNNSIASGLKGVLKEISSSAIKHTPDLLEVAFARDMCNFNQKQAGLITSITEREKQQLNDYAEEALSDVTKFHGEIDAYIQEISKSLNMQPNLTVYALSRRLIEDVESMADKDLQSLIIVRNNIEKYNKIVSMVDTYNRRFQSAIERINTYKTVYTAPTFTFTEVDQSVAQKIQATNNAMKETLKQNSNDTILKQELGQKDIHEIVQPYVNLEQRLAKVKMSIEPIKLDDMLKIEKLHKLIDMHVRALTHKYGDKIGEQLQSTLPELKKLSDSLTETFESFKREIDALASSFRDSKEKDILDLKEGMVENVKVQLEVNKKAAIQSINDNITRITGLPDKELPKNMEDQFKKLKETIEVSEKIITDIISKINKEKEKGLFSELDDLLPTIQKIELTNPNSEPDVSFSKTYHKLLQLKELQSSGDEDKTKLLHTYTALDIIKLSKDVDSLQTTMRSFMKEIKTENENRQGVENELSKKLLEINLEIISFNTEIREAAIKTRCLSAQLASEIDKLASEIDKLAKELELLNAQYEKLDSEISKLAAQRGDNKVAAKQLTSNLELLKKSIDNFSKKSSRVLEEAKTQQEVLKKEKVRKNTEEEEKRKAAEEKEKRKAVEEEKARKAAEEEEKRKAAEEEKARKAAIQQTSRRYDSMEDPSQEASGAKAAVSKTYDRTTQSGKGLIAIKKDTIKIQLGSLQDQLTRLSEESKKLYEKAYHLGNISQHPNQQLNMTDELSETQVFELQSVAKKILADDSISKDLREHLFQQPNFTKAIRRLEEFAKSRIHRARKYTDINNYIKKASEVEGRLIEIQSAAEKLKSVSLINKLIDGYEDAPRRHNLQEISALINGHTFNLNNGFGKKIKGKRVSDSAHFIWNRITELLETDIINDADYQKLAKEIRAQLQNRTEATTGFFSYLPGARDKTTADLYNSILNKLNEINQITAPAVDGNELNVESGRPKEGKEEKEEQAPLKPGHFI